MNQISVAMATYNGGRFIEPQLDSIAAQTVQPAELVVTDDGSTDDTLVVVERFARRAAFPVHIHRNASRFGYRRNFLHNALLCRSPLIAYCDQDDIWHPAKLARAAQVLEDPNTVLFYHNAELIDAAGASLGPANRAKAPPLNTPSTLYAYMWGLGLVQVFRRSLMTLDNLWAGSMDVIEPHHPMSHDMWTFFLASTFGQIAYSDEQLISYRQHGENTVGFTPASGSWAKAMVRKGADDYARLAKVSWNRKLILDAAQQQLTGEWQEKARMAAALYERLARRFELRTTIYSGSRLAERGRSLVSLLQAGAYGRDTAWGFSTTSLIKDVLTLACLRPLAGVRKAA